MSEKTEDLLKTEKAMKQKTGTNMAVTNTVIFAFDIILLITAAFLYQSGTVGFDSVIIPVIALMSSFGPVVALANLGSTLQNTFAAGNRVLNILDESPVVEEITGKKMLLSPVQKLKMSHSPTVTKLYSTMFRQI